MENSTFVDFKKHLHSGYILHCPMLNQLIPPRDLDPFSFCYPTADIWAAKDDEREFGPFLNASKICYITDICYEDHYNRYVFGWKRL